MRSCAAPSSDASLSVSRTIGHSLPASIIGLPRAANQHSAWHFYAWSVVCVRYVTDRPTSGDPECVRYTTDPPTLGPECATGVGDLVKVRGAGTVVLVYQYR